MQNFVFLFLCGICINWEVVSCKPQMKDSVDSVILKYENEPYSGQLDGQQVYKYSYKTSNQIEAEQTAKTDANGDIVIEGFYSYVDPSNRLQRVTYIADSKGYRLETIKLPVKPRGDQRILSVALTSLAGGVG